MARTSASSGPLTDHDEIRRWAEERGAKPTCVRGTGGGEDVGMIRLDFPGYSGAGKLEEISWDEWFDKFDESGLALLVQDQTARGQKSNFNKLVSKETAGVSGSGRESSRRARVTASGSSRSRRRQSRATGSSRTARSSGSEARRSSQSGRSRSARSSRTRSASAKRSQTKRTSRTSAKTSVRPSARTSAKSRARTTAKKASGRVTGRSSRTSRSQSSSSRKRAA